MHALRRSFARGASGDSIIARMDPALMWAISGLALVIVELLTGTFYLLVLGVAAFGAAGTAWLGYDFPAQVIVAAVIAAVGCYAVHAYREKNRTQQMAPV